MKKTQKILSVLLSLLMALLMLAPLGAVSVAADGENTPEDTIVTVVESGDCGAEGSDVHYTLYSDGTLEISGSGVIKQNAFYRNQAIKSLVIKEGVTSMALSAFSGCLSMETAVLPDSFERIGDWAFYCCRALKSLAGGNHMKSLGKGALAATGLEKYRIPDSVETIDECLYLFDDSEAIEEVIFGSGMQELSDGSLQDFKHGTLKKVVFLNKDTVIPGNYYFNGTADPNGERVTFYSYAGGAVEAFANQYGHPFVDLNELHEGRACEWDEGRISRFPTCGMPGEITYYCTIDPSHIRTESIPVSAHAWGDWTIAQNPTDMEPGLATAVCANDPTHVKTVAIPAHGPAVEFGDCGQDGDEVYYVVYEDGTMLVFGQGAIRYDLFNSGSHTVSPNVLNATRLVIEDGITGIGSGAFAFCRFESITFPGTLETIGYDAFYDCDGFEEIVLPDSVKTVDSCAFGLSSNLKKITFGKNVETVGDWALLQCYALRTVVFLNGNTQIIENDHSLAQGVYYQDILYTIPCGTVYSYAGGSVEAYANEKGLRFVPLDEDGHVWDAGEITTPATCVGGEKTVTCELCGATKPVALPANDTHIWGEWVVTKMATEDEEGLAVRTCQNDPTHKETKTIDKLPPTFEEEENIFVRMFHWIEEFFQRIGEAFRNLFSIFD